MIIGSLRGALADRAPSGEVLVDVGGVGYRVWVSARTGARLPTLGSEVFLQVHHHIREDHQQLYGFATRDERVCFEALLGARGVGPALALAILGVHSPEALARVLAEDDLDALCLVPGVGKKTAARLIIELKERLDVETIGAVASAVRSGGAPDAAHAAGTPLALVAQALGQLGYAPDEVRRALADLPTELDGEPIADEGVLLRGALRRIGG